MSNAIIEKLEKRFEILFYETKQNHIVYTYFFINKQSYRA